MYTFTPLFTAMAKEFLAEVDNTTLFWQRRVDDGNPSIGDIPGRTRTARDGRL